MKRDLNRLADEHFDLLVIGGGITGACIARDAAMRGLSVALIEKNDFAHATSAHNSKLIHGGLRYLRNLELQLVRESLRERRIWQRIAPHLVHPLPFFIPLYSAGWRGRAALTAGLSLYDMLSFDRGWLDEPAQRLPGHRWLDAKSALTHEPSLNGDQFEGAFEYHDAQMYSPERLTLECVLDAEAHGAVPANHLSAENLLLRGGQVEGARATDNIDGAWLEIRAQTTVIAVGPWADVFLAKALGKPVSHRLMRSKGIHLIVQEMTRTHALTIAANGGHFFVLPWRGHSLLGTTDTAFTGSPDLVGVRESDIATFLKLINGHLQSARLTRADVQHFYAGLRPLVDDGRGSTYNASRRAELIDHGRDDGVHNLFSAIGGKWTTSRDLAEKVVDTVVVKLGKSAGLCTSAIARLPGAPAASLALPSEHIARMYGIRARLVLRLAEANPRLRQILSRSGDIAAQVAFAMREEMALTLEDVIMRRTGIGQLGHPGAVALETCAQLMADKLGWTPDRMRAEIAAVEQNFRTLDAVSAS
ncbi:MAG TPA: glycerol-3-phosphate dehydrogenase/oxidase [Rhizomicrobium sp.]|jgi:glycerol-3-phosphate dehydrogenase|nr:glycerol-3-phosphate dehydrogenase/oxidase [Rhizomicrobium sp.]